LITLLESNFSCPFTVELVDEANLIYLDKKPSLGLESMPHVTWPRYAASNVFFSGTLDYIMGAGFHNKFLIQLMSRFVQYEDMSAKT